MATLTPGAILMGFFPILDILDCLIPNAAYDFAAELAAAGFDARHDAARRRYYRDAKPAQYARNVLPPAEPAETRLGLAPQAAYHGLLLAVVLERYAKRLLRLAVRLEIGNVAFLLENLGDIRLHARRGHLYDFNPRALGIADPGEHVCYWI